MGASLNADFGDMVKESSKAVKSAYAQGVALTVCADT